MKRVRRDNFVKVVCIRRLISYDSLRTLTVNLKAYQKVYVSYE